MRRPSVAGSHIENRVNRRQAGEFLVQRALAAKPAIDVLNITEIRLNGGAGGLIEQFGFENAGHSLSVTGGWG